MTHHISDLQEVRLDVRNTSLTKQKQTDKIQYILSNDNRIIKTTLSEMQKRKHYGKCFGDYAHKNGNLCGNICCWFTCMCYDDDE